LVAAARGRRWGRFRVAVVEVFRSELRPGGPRYTPLGAVRLAPAGADGGP
jgi:2'-5' RNA ligase